MNYGRKWKETPETIKIYVIEHLNQNHNKIKLMNTVPPGRIPSVSPIHQKSGFLGVEVGLGPPLPPKLPFLGSVTPVTRT
jgi:hypothetical protein